MKRKSSEDKSSDTKVEFPWFLIGFISMGIVGSYVFGVSVPVSDEWLNGISVLTTWCLTAAMVGLGLNVSLRDLKMKTLKSLIAMGITSICLSILAYFIR